MPFSSFFGGVIGVPPAAPGATDIPDEEVVPVVVVETVSTASRAIVFYWNSRLELTSAVPGKLWTGEAPSTVTTLPYAVLTQVSDVEQARSTGGTIHAATYQLSIMADDLAEAESTCRTVAVAYDEAAIPLDGLMTCFAGDTRWTLGVGLGLGGEDCWTCYVELEISYTR